MRRKQGLAFEWLVAVGDEWNVSGLHRVLSLNSSEPDPNRKVSKITQESNTFVKIAEKLAGKTAYASISRCGMLGVRTDEERPRATQCFNRLRLTLSAIDRS